jgi:hypothetical protein
MLFFPMRSPRLPLLTPLALALAASLTPALAAPARDADPRPNFVFTIADGVGDVGALAPK